MLQGDGIDEVSIVLTSAKYIDLQASIACVGYSIACFGDTEILPGTI